MRVKNTAQKQIWGEFVLPAFDYRAATRRFWKLPPCPQSQCHPAPWQTGEDLPHLYCGSAPGITQLRRGTILCTIAMPAREKSENV